MPAAAVARVKEEVRKVLVAAVFFSAGFCLILVADRLITRGSGVELASFVRALVGGLIVAKLLLIVDLFPFVHAFPDTPLVHNIVWKSSLYIAASLVFTYLEPFTKHLFRGLGLSAAHSLALQRFTLPRTWAIEIWLAMLLMAFVTMRELTRVVGEGEMKRMFFGSRDKPPVETGVRRAA
jgi:hypothetical protein